MRKGLVVKIALSVVGLVGLFLIWYSLEYSKTFSFLETAEIADKLGNYHESLENLDKAKASIFICGLFDSNLKYRIDFNRGVALYRLNQIGNAQDAFIQALGTSDFSFKADIYYNLGHVQLYLRNYSKTTEYWIKALKANPDHSSAKYNLEWLQRNVSFETKRGSQVPKGLRGLSAPKFDS